jgi:hypothetical protein
MPNLVMDFLQGAKNLAENVASPFEYVGEQDIVRPSEILYNQAIGNPQRADQLNQQEYGSNASASKEFGNVAQIATDFAAPGIAGTVGKVLPEAGGIVGGAIKGATEGAALGGIQNTEQGATQGDKNLAMDFIHGAETGAAFGGVTGGAIPAVKAVSDNLKPLNQVGAVGSNVNALDDDMAKKLAQTQDQKTIEDTLKPVTGDIVAHDVAPAIAQTDDPNVVKNIVKNDVNSKTAPATPETTGVSEPPSLPQPLPPSTSVSDVNTPQQVAGQATTEEDQSPFLNNPKEEAPTTGQSQVSKAGVLQGMHDILNSGGTTDDAIMHYFNNVPEAGYGEAKNALDNVIGSAGTDKSKINASLNPQYENTNFPEATTRDAAVLNGRYAGNKLLEVGRPAVQAMQQLDDHDLALVRSLRGRDPATIVAQAHDPEQFAKVVQTLKDYNDYTQAAGAKLGQDLPYRQNYGLRTPFLSPAERDAANAEPGTEPVASLPTDRSYTKQRMYNTYEEALQNGEVPRNANALEDLQSDINMRSHDQAQLALAKGLEQTYPGQVKIINNGQIPTGYQQLLIPNGDKIFMPKDIASDINKRVMAEPPDSKFWKGYDTLNAAGKNLELGGGLFHSFNTGGIFAGQQLASGDLFKDPTALGKVVQNTLSDNATQKYMDTIGKEGSFDENHSVINAADAAGLKYSHTAADVGSPEDKGLVGKVSSIPVLKQIHQAIFDRQIPTMMLETFRQKTQGLDVFGNPADREEAISIAKAINQSYGSLNRDIQGLTPKQFQQASRVLLATGYQEGQIRTLVDALNPKNFGTAAGKIAREAVFGKALVFGGLATLGSVAGGQDFKDQSPSQVALGIMNKAINPSFDIAGYKVSLPATQISNIAKPVEESVAGAKKGQGIAKGPEDFASSHLAFLPSKAEEFGTNKNFEGNAIYGKDYFGRPISAGSVAENAVSGIAPIPLAQTAQTATGSQSVGAAIANTVGFNAAPEYNLNYAPIAGQTYVQELQDAGASKQKIASTTQFFDLLEQGSKAKAKTITAAETAIKAGDQNKANQLIQDYNKQLTQKLLPWEQQGGTSYLDMTMLQLLRTAELTYKKANQNVNYVTQTNPTSIGASIAALAQQPKIKQAAGQGV